MKIHKSHSKSDLIYLLKQFNIDLDKKKNKNEIIQDINDNFDNIEYDKINDFEIKNKGDLLHHLENENKEGKIDTIEKEIVMNKAKRIIHFGKCKYNIQSTEYNDIQEIYGDCLYIHKYGFIPSVRRALKIHNDCLFKIGHINPVLPKKVQREMQQKRSLKRVQHYNCKITHGTFLISFD
jgi:hypothetical protein